MKKYTTAQLVRASKPVVEAAPVAEYAPGDVIPGLGKVIAVGRKLTPPAPEGWTSVETFAPDQGDR